MDGLRSTARHKGIDDLTAIAPLILTTIVLAAVAAPQGAASTACVAVTGLAGIATATLFLRRLAQFRATQTRLVSALEAIPDGIAIFDAADRFVFFNACYPEHLAQPLRARLALGLRFSDWLRQGLADGPVYHPSMGEDFPRRRLAIREATEGEHVHRLADGRWIRIRERQTPEGGRVLLTTNITEARRRSEDLRILAAAVEQIGDPVEITAADHGFTYVNRAFEVVTGWTRQEALGRQPQDILASGQHPPAFFEEILETLESGESWKGIIINQRRDGELIEQETTISPLRDDEGRITHYVAVKRDVTQARAQARALAASEARLRAVVNTQTEFIVRINPEGRWTFMNEACERYIGLTLDELNTRGYRDPAFILPDDQPIYDAHIAELTPATPTHTVEWRSLHLDGSVHWEQWTDTGIFDELGRLVEVQCVGREVTDRRLAELAREQAERQRRAALEAALECFIGVSSDGVVIEFNAAAERTFGYSRDEAIGQPMSELIVPPHLRAAHERGMRRHFGTGETNMLGRRLEVDAMRADGSTFPIELVIVAAEQSTDTAYFAYLRDLSERKAAERALEEREAQFRAISESVPVGRIISDLETARPLYINPLARRNLGMGPDELPDTLMAVWEDPAQRRRLLASLADGKASESIEARLVMPDGRRMTALVSATGISWHGRESLLVATVDVTALRETEQALRDSQARLATIIEANPVAMNIAGLSDRKLLFVNRPYLQTFGIDEAELGTFDPDRLYADPSERDRIFNEIAAGREVIDAELKLRRKDGTEFPASLTSRPILFQGEPAIVTSTIDLTALRAAQAEVARSREALHQSEKMTALGSLLAGVAHELNNPLSVVVGYASLLRELVDEPAMIARVEKIHGAAERCARIVRSFLAMARARPPLRGPVAMGEVVLGALELTGYGLRSADVASRIEIDPGLPPVWGDADQLHQVLVNLIVNAQHALIGRTPPRELTIRVWIEGDEIITEVADNGPGMSQETAKRAFEPFFTTKPQGVGTGVGLSVCHGIVAAHGGRITLDTAEGHGARFRVALPRAPEEVTAESVAPAAPRRSGRVLVVDDESDIAALLGERLKAKGYEIETAASGRRALAAVKEVKFDAVITDLRMPDMDGAALTEEILALKPELDGLILLMTGDALGAELDRRLKASGAPVFEKPIDFEALSAELARRLLERSPH